MKKITFLIITIFLLAAPAFASPKKPPLPPADSFAVCALDTLDSGHAVNGQTIRFRLCQDITLTPDTTLKAGEILTGTITKAEKGSAWGCPGKLTLQAPLCSDAHMYGKISLHGVPPNFFIQVSLFGVFIKGQNAKISAGKNYSMQIISQP